MAHQDGDKNPLLKPRLVRAMRKRPKLVEIEAREKFLEELDQNICERRTSNKVAETLVRNTERALERPAANTLGRGIERLNQNTLERF